MASAAEPVESGQSYTITHVDGREPESLDDFTGDVHLTLVRNGQQLHVEGAVTRTADSLRLYQKDLALQDRDIRVWTITGRDNSDEHGVDQICSPRETAGRPSSSSNAGRGSSTRRSVTKTPSTRPVLANSR